MKAESFVPGFLDELEKDAKTAVPREFEAPFAGVVRKELSSRLRHMRKTEGGRKVSAPAYRKHIREIYGDPMRKHMESFDKQQLRKKHLRKGLDHDFR